MMIKFAILGLLRRLQKLQIQVDLESTSDATGIIYPWHQLHKKKIGINDKNPMKKVLQCGIELGTSCIIGMFIAHQSIIPCGKLMGCLTYHKRITI